MALPFFKSRVSKRDQMVAIDLGGRTTKAVHLQRRGDGLALCGYALLDTPIFDKTLSADLLAEHLRAVSQVLPAKTRYVTLTVGANDVVVRPVEMPRIPVEDMRLVLKNNSRNYMQQDMSAYVFDCYIIPPWHQTTPPESPRGPAAGGVQ